MEAKTKTQSEKLLASPSDPRPVVKIGLAVPFQIVGGDVFTFIDCLKHRVTMTEADRGVEVVLASKLQGPNAPAPKSFLVPWSNVTYVLRGV